MADAEQLTAPGRLRTLGHLAWPERWPLAGVAVAVAISAVAAAIAPWPLALVADSVVGTRSLPTAVRNLQALPGAGEPTGLLVWLAAIGLAAVSGAGLR